MSKRLSGLFGVITLLLAMHANASTWTVTATGFISDGIDGLNLFGLTGISRGDLSGMRFTQVITASTSLSDYTNLDVYNQKGLSVLYSGIGSFSDTATVSGKSATVNVQTSTNATQSLSNAISIPSNFQQDTIYTYNTGLTADGQEFTAYSSASSTTDAFVSSLNFGQSLYRVITGNISTESNFDLYDPILSQATRFTGTIDSITITANGDADVPEPAPLALLGIGLFGFLASRRRAAK